MNAVLWCVPMGCWLVVLTGWLLYQWVQNPIPAKPAPVYRSVWDGDTPLRLYANEPGATDWHVRCNGERVPHAYAADSREGWVLAYADEDGHPFVCGGEIARTCARGNVEFYR